MEKNERGSLAISSVRRGKKPNTHKTNKTRQTNRKKPQNLGTSVLLRSSLVKNPKSCCPQLHVI